MLPEQNTNFYLYYQIGETLHLLAIKPKEEMDSLTSKHETEKNLLEYLLKQNKIPHTNVKLIMKTHTGKEKIIMYGKTEKIAIELMDQYYEIKKIEQILDKNIYLKEILTMEMYQELKYNFPSFKRKRMVYEEYLKSNPSQETLEKLYKAYLSRHQKPPIDYQKKLI